jgi:hypothetical protein
MKVGDLVKVYDFSHEARRRLIKEPHATELKDLRVDAHYVGLVVASSDSDPKYRRVMRCVDGEWEDYNVNRLEVIA